MTENEGRTRQQWTTSTDKKLLNELRELSRITRIPVSRLMDEAIELLLEKHRKKN